MPRDQRQSLEAEDVFLEDLRGVLWNCYKDTNMSWKEIAGRSRLAYSTVRKFASGDTKRPQFQTVFKLMSTMGVTISYTRTGKI